MSFHVTRGGCEPGMQSSSGGTTPRCQPNRFISFTRTAFLLHSVS